MVGAVTATWSTTQLAPPRPFVGPWFGPTALRSGRSAQVSGTPGAATRGSCQCNSHETRPSLLRCSALGRQAALRLALRFGYCWVMAQCPHCAKPTSGKAAKCAHCGRALSRTEARPEHQSIRCPRCAFETDVVRLASVELDLCRKCRGLWFDSAELRSFGDALSDSALNRQVLELMRELGSRSSRAGESAYIACPICQSEMSRTNYARISGIILHRCLPHGSWADHDAALRLIELMANDGDARLRALEDERVKRELVQRVERLESGHASQEVRLSKLDLRGRIHLVLDWLDFL